ncbi:MAG: 50S ribosomal protein L37e [Nanoarchaeota archaeon]
MTKGTPSMGKMNKRRSHIYCRRCGGHAYHIHDKVCAKCGYGRSTKLRAFTWQKKKTLKS